MSEYIVSARKYRPDTFKSVVGQDALTTTLKNAITENKLAHAYLFCGPRGVGKTSCARIFAKTVNCTHRTPEGEACNECESCLSYNEQRSYNILELDAASNNTVDDIRNLIEQVRIPPMTGKYRVYIIDEVHMLSTQAFNAFLKTLEEPPSHAIFVLATTDKHKVLPTIISRCQVYDFNRISTKDIADHLAYVASQEGITAERDALETIAVNADGGMRDALSIFDQVAGYGKGVITYRAVLDNLSLIDESEYFKMLAYMFQGQIAKLMGLVDELIRRGYDARTIISGLTTFLRNVMMSQDPATQPLVESSETIRQRYIGAAQYCKPGFVWNALKIATEFEGKYRYAGSKRLALEVALMQMAESKAVELQMPSEPAGAPSTSEPGVAFYGKSPESARYTAAPTAVEEKPKAVSELTVKPKSATKRSVSTGIRNRYSYSLSGTPEETEQTTTILKRNKPYSIQQLQEAWRTYASGITNQILLKQTMQDCLPELSEQEGIVITVSANSQKELLQDIEEELMSFLSDKLQNDHLTLSIRVEAEGAHTIPTHPKDKQAYFEERSPAFRKFMDDLDLTVLS